MKTLASKGQFGFVSVIILAIIFLIVFALAISGLVDSGVNIALSFVELTGLEAFLLRYLNLWIFLAFALATFVAISVGGNQ